MDTIPTYVIAGIPLSVLVFAIVEEIKAYGLTGKILRFVSLLVGIIVSVFYQLGFLGVPSALEGWVTVVVVGLFYGLTASGAYDFMDARTTVR